MWQNFPQYENYHIMNKIQKGVQSIERAFQILRVVHRHLHGVGVSEVSDKTGLHTSTSSRIVGTLERIGALKRIDGKLFVGEEIIELASRAPLTERLISMATPVLRELAVATKEAVGLTLIEGDACHVFYQIPSSHHIQIRDWTGMQFPLHVTSTGKLFLAGLDEPRRTRYRDRPLEKIAPKTKEHWAELECEFAHIRVDGVAWTVDELEEGLTSAAVPIHEPNGQFVAGLYVSIPNYRLRDKSTLAQQIQDAARHIERQLELNAGTGL